MSLKGKVAIVTGGNSGIGLSIVLELAKQEANIVIDYVADLEATEALEQQVAALGDRNHATTAPENQYRTAGERRAEGKALREAAVAREDHREWKAPKHRRDPIELVLESNEGRMPDLVPIRHGRMLQSRLAFYRRTAASMAADLAHTPSPGSECRPAETLIC